MQHQEVGENQLEGTAPSHHRFSTLLCWLSRVGGDGKIQRKRKIAIARKGLLQNGVGKGKCIRA